MQIFLWKMERQELVCPFYRLKTWTRSSCYGTVGGIVNAVAQVTTVAWVWSLAWEFLYATGAAKKKTKKQKQKQTKPNTNKTFRGLTKTTVSTLAY